MGLFSKIFKADDGNATNEGPLDDRIFSTTAGMLCLWNYASFSHIADFGDWEAALSEDEDIVFHIENGRLVPINLQRDGAWKVEVRVGPSAVLTDRERRNVLAESADYLLNSDGVVYLSGLEHVKTNPGLHARKIKLAAGIYQVKLFALGFDDDYDSDADGAVPTSLADFVVFINAMEDRSIPISYDILPFDLEAID